MYQCKTHPIQSRKAKRVIAEANRLLSSRRQASRGSRPYVRVKFLGKGRKRVFIEDVHYHIDEKSFRDMVGRYRLLPCVWELLRHTTDTPEPTPRGNLKLIGMTPEGESFAVIIRPEKEGGVLQSFYPL